MILKLGDEVVNVVHGAFGFDAAVGLVEDGGDFVLGHDEVASGLRLLRKFSLWLYSCGVDRVAEASRLFGSVGHRSAKRVVFVGKMEVR